MDADALAIDGLVIGPPVGMRRASLTRRMMTCGKPNCRCHKLGARHGPYWQVSWYEVGGKHRSRWLSAAEAVIVARQIEAARRWQQQKRGEDAAWWQQRGEEADKELGRPCLHGNG